MQAPSHLQERHHLIGAPGHSLGKQTTPSAQNEKIIWHVYYVHVLAMAYWLLRRCYAPFPTSALHYEVLLKESRPANEQGSPHRHHGSKTTPTGPSQERIDTCFQVLGKLKSCCPRPCTCTCTRIVHIHADDLLVHLGIYQRVMKLVRDELYGIIFYTQFNLMTRAC
jgi:hypothetical protein